MKKKIRDFIKDSFSEGRDRNFVQKKLLGYVSDLEMIRALKYFDKLSKNNRGNSLVLFFKSGVSLIKILFYSIYLCFVELKVSLRKFLRGGEEIDLAKPKNLFLLKKLKEWFSKKSKKERMIFIFGLIFFMLVLIFLVFTTFIYSENCENARCFEKMVADCHRASFVSEDLINFESKIIGLTSRGCRVEVSALSSGFGINRGSEMVCYISPGLEVLPQSRLVDCSGKLREEIQGTIISELYKNLGQDK